jgi:CubicO group peptidase (beta-lactamase class C family)
MGGDPETRINCFNKTETFMGFYGLCGETMKVYDDDAEKRLKKPHKKFMAEMIRGMKETPSQNANDPNFYAYENPAAGIVASARGLAKLGAYLANKGTFEGKALISEETHNLMHANSRTLPDALWVYRTTFTQGGLCHYDNDATMKGPKLPAHIPIIDKMEVKMCKPRDKFYGWLGWGGGVF